MPSESLETLHDLFVHELRDLYDAENQLIKALPLLSQAAQSDELREAFTTHLRETEEQARRIERVFKGLGEKPSGKSCKAMQGLVAEAREVLDQDADPQVMDAALIVAAQKVEHYEIAGYGSVCTFGRVLGYDDATNILKQTIEEEERADKLLTALAEQLNPQAKSADTADENSGSDRNDDLSDLNAGARNVRTTGGNRGGSSTRTASNRGRAGQTSRKTSSRGASSSRRGRSSGRSRKAGARSGR
jgi:ferritin-like metal-binding protein YciE